MSIIHHHKSTPFPGQFVYMTSCGELRSLQQITFGYGNVTCKRCTKTKHYKKGIANEMAYIMKG